MFLKDNDLNLNENTILKKKKVKRILVYLPRNFELFLHRIESWIES